jgi:hypothetical protein
LSKCEVLLPFKQIPTVRDFERFLMLDTLMDAIHDVSYVSQGPQQTFLLGIVLSSNLVEAIEIFDASISEDKDLGGLRSRLSPRSNDLEEIEAK